MTGLHAELGIGTSARAARPAPGRALGQDRVALSSSVAATIGILVGGIVELTGEQGRRLVARVDDIDPAAPNEPDVVRLGRMLWQQLSTRPGSPVTVVAAELNVAERVVFQPGFELSRHLRARITEALRESQAVVAPAAAIFSTVFGGGGGVRLAVSEIAGPGVVGPATEIIFAEPSADVVQPPPSLGDIGGLDNEIARLRELIELPLLRPGLYRSLGIRPAKGVILHGPPGVGKTLLSRAVAAEFGVGVRKLAATELVGTYSGETEANLRSLFNEAAHHAPSLIVIDEIDVLTTSRERLASQGDIRAVTQLLSLMDGLDEVDGVVVLATTNRIDSVDEAFRRPGRFDEELYLGNPGPLARREILAVHTREMPLSEEAEKALHVAALVGLAGFSGADILHLCREIGLAAVRRTASAGARGVELADSVANEPLVIIEADVADGLRLLAPSALRRVGADSPVTVAWDRIVGLDDAKARLLRIAEAAVDPYGNRGGILLCGPPGNGKTVVARALAERVGANFLQIDASSIFTQWLGESEAALRALFAKAVQIAPVVVAIEHLDAIAPARGEHDGDNASRRVLAALLASIDSATAEAPILVVGVTDRPDLVDRTVVRSGRLGARVTIENPDDARRLAIAEQWNADASGPLDHQQLCAVVAQTADQSAADLLASLADECGGLARS
ncbi:MAG TPA: AAA family ATPase [Trebonia sp.]|jgi:transitional endoplasmic reticulum ATPase